ncbi:Ribosomal protein L10/acidic P0 [Carpediemonas membranifera]|uniref:Ribosomal protein L10/acidic P0 n=1 Tax=Carpediemonas membranifera TaxID=201153 RepID=A0A8J6E0F3_9EUKA|nr:Ribosomal protein L10/acidic P0 [Carpediemonas membranifera]|eukprot:KAG9391766.1 Ribosomal protein L10/acidic P0 [Carpediemonas membranifera]
MPRNRRDRDFALTEVEKKGREQKEELVAKIRDEVKDAAYVYVIQHKNLVSSKMGNVRELLQVATKEHPGGRIFNGKKRVMAIALSGEDVPAGLDGLVKDISGDSMLFVSSSGPKLVQSFFNKYSEPVAATAGNIATEDVEIPEGPLDKIEFPFPLEPRLRALGLPCKLHEGVITLLHDYTICNEGDELTAKQAKLLTHFGYEMANMTFKVTSYWSKSAKANPVKKLA